MNIAIFGGTFNPVHNEHINIALSAIKNLKLDKLFVIPTNITPKKGGRMVADGIDRYNMCRLAFSGFERVVVDDFELKSGGVSYSYITCQEFVKRYPNANRYFIVGGDMLENFPSWKNPQSILKDFTLAVCARVDSEKLKTGARVLEEKFGAKPVILDYVGEDVSSTKLRALLSAGEDISQYVDKKVAQYASTNGIFALPFAEKVKSFLTKERWAHTVRVCVCAAIHSAKFGIDEKSAITAAILHDCAKYIPINSILLKDFTPPENVPEPVMHQFTGAYIAANLFNIQDEDILNAIRYHTSGRENMSDLEKLIYLSDMVEEGRNFDGVEEIRAAFETSLNSGMMSALTHQVNYLSKDNKKIYPLTMRAYEYMRKNNDK